MPDITMCWGWNCEVADRCYRFRAQPNEYRQSFFADKPKCNIIMADTETVSGSFATALSGQDIEIKTVNVCEYFWDINKASTRIRSYEDALNKSREILGSGSAKSEVRKLQRRTLGSKMFRDPYPDN